MAKDPVLGKHVKCRVGTFFFFFVTTVKNSGFSSSSSKTESSIYQRKKKQMKWTPFVCSSSLKAVLSITLTLWHMNVNPVCVTVVPSHSVGWGQRVGVSVLRRAEGCPAQPLLLPRLRLRIRSSWSSAGVPRTRSAPCLYLVCKGTRQNRRADP